jgi:D-arabinan exo alpha-(1,3)/(1,5)-arabinofuranosidase (non-reducing end)
MNRKGKSEMRNALLILSILTVSFAGMAEPVVNPMDALTMRQDYEARRASSSSPDLDSNGDALPILPGKTLVLLDADGPGVITHFWNTIAAFDPFSGRSVVLRIYYDGNAEPSVQVPLGDFFGVGHGALKPFTSAPVSVSAGGLARTCYWHMPFRKHIKVTVTNESPTYPVASFYYYLDWQKHDSLPEDTMYFHAQYRQSMPAAPGHYTILETKGTGHYVGTVYSVQQVEMGWFGEGDDFIYIDGAKTPQLRGTGTEDYFNDAWGFREFNTPYHGVSLYEGGYPGDRVTAYRWHIADPIPFKDSIRVTIEHRGSVFDETAEKAEDFSLASSNERPDWVSSVGFWYQYPPATITEPLPPADKRIAPYRIIPVQSLTYRASPTDTVNNSFVGVTYLPTTDDAAIEFDFDVDEAGRYQIGGIFQDNIAGAIFQVYLDGVKAGPPVNMVTVGSGFMWHEFDLHDLQPGTHTLRFEKTGIQSPEARTIAPNYMNFTIEYLILLRLEDMEGYHTLYDRMKR